MTRRKLPHEKLKPGPKPKVSADTVQVDAPEQAQPAPEVVTVTTLAPVVAEKAAPVAARWDDPLQRNRPVDAMDEAELRQYGIQIGLSRRDASDLGVDRLRTACKQRVYDLIEEI